MEIRREKIAIGKIISPATINLFAFLAYEKRTNVPYYYRLSQKAELFEDYLKQDLELQDSAILFQQKVIWIKDCYCLIGAEIVAKKILHGEKYIECITVEKSGILTDWISNGKNIFTDEEQDFLISYFFRYLKPGYSVHVQKCSRLPKGKTSIEINKNVICKKIAVTKRGIANIRKICSLAEDISSIDEKNTLKFIIETQNVGGSYKQDKENRNLIPMIFNENSVDLLNNGNPFRYKEYNNNLMIFKGEMRKEKVSLEDVIIDSSGILGLYGLRNPRDIDYISMTEVHSTGSDCFMECHNDLAETYEETLEELIYNPQNYLYFNDIKFVERKKVERACFNQPWFTKKLDIVLLNTIGNEDKLNSDEKFIVEAIKGIYKVIRLRKLKNGG